MRNVLRQNFRRRNGTNWNTFLKPYFTEANRIRARREVTTLTSKGRARELKNDALVGVRALST